MAIFNWVIIYFFFSDTIDAKFITSAPTVNAAPDSIEQNEVVFMARSNVGKSSFINSLTGRKNLAKSSSTPGKTRLINFLDITFSKDENDHIKSFALKTTMNSFYGAAASPKSRLYNKEVGEAITNFIC